MITNETKILLGIAIATIAILIIGIVVLNGAQKTQSVANTNHLVGDNSNQRKGKNTKATLVAFSDFQCPACAAAEPFLAKLLKEEEGNITFAYRHFPLPQHQFGLLAAKAAEAAGKQGKFWQMHAILFQNQQEWSTTTDPLPKFTKYATSLTLDKTAFLGDMRSNEIQQKIDADISDANVAGVNATPTFFLNGKKLNLSSFSSLETEVKKMIYNNK